MRIFWVLSVVAALFAAGSTSRHTIEAQAKPDPKGRANTELLRVVGSYGGALFCLAYERFAAHEAKKETWVIAVHNSADWSSLKKYRQGQLFVVSIPARDMELEGLRLYGAHYNAFTTRKADLLALAGRYQDALDVYRVLQRHNNCGFAPSDDPAPRIECASKLLRNEDSAACLERLSKLTTKYGDSALSILETKAATPTSDLLDITLDPW